MPAAPTRSTWYAPAQVVGLAVTTTGLRIFGETFSIDAAGDGTSMEASLLRALGSGTAQSSVERILCRGGAFRAVAAEREEPEPPVVTTAHGTAILGARAECPACIRATATQEGRQTPALAAALAPSVAWLTGLARAAPELGYLVSRIVAPETQITLVVPWSRRAGCPRCRPRRLDRRVARLVDPLRGPVRGVTNAPDGRDTRAFVLDVRLAEGARLVAGAGKVPDPGLGCLVSIAEAVERFAFFNDAPDLEGVRRAELVGPSLDPRAVGGFLPVQHARSLTSYPAYDDALRLPWKRVVDLETGSATWSVHDGGVRPCGLWRGTTSGWAAYSSREQAIVRATLELVERDAFLASWLGRLPATRLSVKNHPAGVELRDAGWEARCFLLRSDLGIPVVTAVATAREDPRFPRGATFAGCAATLSLEESIAAALTDAAQTLGWLGRARPATTRAPAKPWEHHLTYVRAGGERAFRFLEAEAVRRPRLPAAVDLASKGALETLRRRLASRGKCIYWYAASTLPRGSAIHVVRAIVPGLLPIGFGPTAQLPLAGYAARLRELGVSRPRSPLQRPVHPL